MVRISVFYASKPGGRFDVEYYLNTHIPMAARLLGGAIKAITVDIGRSGEEPGSLPPFAAICGFTCATVEDFMGAFMPVADQLRGDMPKYTDIEPEIQISDIRIG